MTQAGRSLAWQGLGAAIVFALLVSLGLWQLRRLEWKEALISRIETRAGLAPVDLPPRAGWASLAPDDYDFLHVRAEGRFAPDKDIFVFAPPPANAGPEPGYQLISPFLLADGGAIFVNRGFVSISAAKKAGWREEDQGGTTIHGVLRPPQKRNSFTPADDPQKNLWFTRDPESFARHLGVADAAPFVMDEDPGDPPAAGLVRDAVRADEIPNNHLSYALTWFGLAGALAALFTIYAWGAVRRR